jgi:5-methylcytosine-specific restriction endonuclease McrA
MKDDDPLAADEFRAININPATIKKEQYVLLSNEQDRDSAHRWHMLNTIRKKKVSVKEKILEYLRANVGKQITGDEMKYLAKDKSDWPRQVRSLRTEDGWPIATKNTGRSDLPVGVYVLEEDRRAEPHDRAIKDDVRVEVLSRDDFACTKCGWNHAAASVSDPRKRLELHHVVAHKDKGSNEADNLTTLCNVCHVKAHRSV